MWTTHYYNLFISPEFEGWTNCQDVYSRTVFMSSPAAEVAAFILLLVIFNFFSTDIILQCRTTSRHVTVSSTDKICHHPDVEWTGRFSLTFLETKPNGSTIQGTVSIRNVWATDKYQNNGHVPVQTST